MSDFVRTKMIELFQLEFIEESNISQYSSSGGIIPCRKSFQRSLKFISAKFRQKQSQSLKHSHCLIEFITRTDHQKPHHLSIRRMSL